MADYIEIKDLVNDIMLTLDEDNYDKGQKYHQLELMALQGLKELSFEVNQEVKTTQLVVDSSLNTLAFPSDAVKILKVGVMGSDGNIHPLAPESRLSLNNGFEATNNEVYDNNSYDNNPLGLGQYGVGGANNVHGYYRIDRDSQQIQFSSEVSGKKVVLEYISNGLSVSQSIGIARVVEITMPTGAQLTDGDSIVFMYVNPLPPNTETFTALVLHSDNNINTPTNPIIPSSTNTFRLDSEFVPSDTSTQVADRARDAINVQSPYHKATSSNGKLTVSYNQYYDWTLSESEADNEGGLYSDSDIEGMSILVIQNGSAPAGLSNRAVPQFAEEALRSYVYWKSIQRKRGVPLGEKQIARKEFYNQKRLARARSQSFSKDEALYTSRKHFKQSPKL